MPDRPPRTPIPRGTRCGKGRPRSIRWAGPRNSGSPSPSSASRATRCRPGGCRSGARRPGSTSSRCGRSGGRPRPADPRASGTSRDSAPDARRAGWSSCRTRRGGRAGPGRSPRRLEPLPYVVGRARRLKPGDPLDPFYRQHSTDGRAGGDLKYLLTSNLTLDATFNPDFGQVEVDPAVVNLTAFETFFPEKRPFFIGGSGTFGFGGFSCFFCSNVSSLSLFYSRRIGRVPQGNVPDGAAYADVPDATTILGAAKATGRTRQGWTIGLLDAVTDRERAPVIVSGAPASQLVEPYTNYFVGRLKKDFNRGNLVFGTMATSVWRRLDDSLLTAKLPAHAEALGFDWIARWKNRTYTLQGNLAFSNVEGDSSAIQRLQSSSARYFQRPDRGNGSNGLFSDRYD